jgi:predicted chitinase
MTLTTGDVQAALNKYNELQGASENITQALVDRINEETGNYTLYRQLAFVAQTIWESGGYRYREEQEAINGGPTQSSYQLCDFNNVSDVATNGQFFYGRGYLQLSYCANYRRYGEGRFGDAEMFYNNASLVATVPYDLDSAAWFFETDVKDFSGQFGLTTKDINGAIECCADITGGSGACCAGCTETIAETPKNRYKIFVALATQVGLTGYSEGGCYN